MGLLDRFRKGDAPRQPDALTREALARVRAQPGVVEADVVDADTLSVTWSPGAEADRLSLAPLRPRWSETSGFERIELMDEWMLDLGPAGTVDPSAPATSTSDDPSTTPADPAASGSAPTGPVGAATSAAGDHPADGAPAAELQNVVDRLVVVVRRTAPTGDPARWTVTPQLEAHLALDRPDALPVTEAELAEWSTDLATARAGAVDRLVHQGPGLDRIDEDMAAWVVTRPEHRAAWLCRPDVLLSEAGLPDAIALAPTPTELVVVDPTDGDAVVAILTSTRTIIDQEQDVLWPVPVELRIDGIGPWEPPEGHPGTELAQEMARLVRDR